VRIRALLLAALAASWVRAEEAGGFSLQATSDLLWQHNLLATGPAGPAPGQYQAALSLVGSRGPWTGGITLRDVNFFRQAPNATLDPPQARIYRAYVKYAPERWSIQAGDFNALVGRGLVLSVVENAAILKEDTIRGAEARWRGGRVETHLLGGTVALEDGSQAWRVAGGEATVEYLEGHRLGIHLSMVQDALLPAFRPPVGLRQCQSASASGKAGALDYYAEVGRMAFRDQQAPLFPVPVDPRRGRGAYGNLSFHPGAWFLMAEYKNYRNFDNALNNPPLADRDTEKNDLFDGAGRRLFAQYAFRDPDLTVFASAGRYSEETSAGHNLYGGFKLQDALGRLDLAWTCGLRTVQYLEQRSDASLTWRFTPLWSLGLTLSDKRNRPPGSDPCQQTDLTAQLARSPKFAVYVIQQRASVPVFDATRLFYGGLRINLARGSDLELSGGRLRGGEVCAGGQCITLPPFKGWKLAARLRW